MAQDGLMTGCNIAPHGICILHFLSTTLSYSPFKILSTPKPGKIFFFPPKIQLMVFKDWFGCFYCRAHWTPHHSAGKNTTQKNSVASLCLPALHTKTRKCGERQNWPNWNAVAVVPSSRLVLIRQTGPQSICEGRVCGEQTWLSKIKWVPMWMALYLTNDKWSFSHEAGLKEGCGAEIEKGRKREGFPRHLGDLGEETLKQHNLNHTARYHQDSLLYVRVHACV